MTMRFALEGQEKSYIYIYIYWYTCIGNWGKIRLRESGPEIWRCPHNDCERIGQKLKWVWQLIQHNAVALAQPGRWIQYSSSTAWVLSPHQAFILEDLLFFLPQPHPPSPSVLSIYLIANTTLLFIILSCNWISPSTIHYSNPLLHVIHYLFFAKN